MVSAIIDIVALVLIITSTIIGFKKGFAKTFVSTFGTILSLVFALLLSGVTAKFLESEFSLTSSIASNIEGSLSKIFGEELMNSPIGAIDNSGIEKVGLSGVIIKAILSIKGNTTLPPETTLSKIIAPTFAYYITVIISVLALYILFKIALFLIAELVIKAHKWKVVKGLDKSLGVFFGILRGIVFVQIIVMIINVLPFNFFNSITIAIPKTILTDALSKINIFPSLIGAITDTTHLIKLIIG